MEREWLRDLIITSLQMESHANMFQEMPLAERPENEHTVTLRHDDVAKILVLAKQAGQNDIVQALIRQLPPDMANMP